MRAGDVETRYWLWSVLLMSEAMQQCQCLRETRALSSVKDQAVSKWPRIRRIPSKFCCKGPSFVVSDTFTKTELALSTRFALESPVQRRKHNAAN